MADIDTIVVLDPIQFQKETTSDVYTQDSANTSSVETYLIPLPVDAKAARVIFNGSFDPDGGRLHIRVKGTGVTSITTPTKTANTQVLEWTALTPATASTGIVHTPDFDCSALFLAALHIDICQSSVTANTTGIEVIVQVKKEDSLDEWTDLTRWTAMVRTAVAVKSDFAAQEAAAQTILSITNPTAGGLDNIGKFIFLEDTATIAQCEIAYIVECGADA